MPCSLVWPMASNWFLLEWSVTLAPGKGSRENRLCAKSTTPLSSQCASTPMSVNSTIFVAVPLSEFA